MSIQHKQNRLRHVCKPSSSMKLPGEIYNWRLYIQGIDTEDITNEVTIGESSNANRPVPGLFLSYANPSTSTTGSVGRGTEGYGGKYSYDVNSQKCKSVSFDGSRLMVTFSNGREVGGDWNNRYMNPKYSFHKNKEEVQQLIKKAINLNLI